MASAGVNKNAAAKPAVLSKPTTSAAPPAPPAAKPQATPAAKPLQEKPGNLPAAGTPFGRAAAAYATAKPSTGTDKPLGGTPGGFGLNARAVVSDKGGDSFAASNRLFLGSNAPAGGGTPGAGTPGSGITPAGAVPGATPVGGVPASAQVQVFGGSQSGENNIDLANAGSGEMLIYAKKNLAKGEADPGGTVLRIPPNGKITVSALDNVGMSFQVYSGQLTPEQQAKLAQGGVVTGVPAPPQTDVLYETNYVPGTHQSFDDISPLDGAKTPMKLEGNGGRTVAITQAIIDGAPIHNPDGSIPGLGPSDSPNNNNARLPELRDYYMRTSLMPDGTRAFYYNSSDSGGADTANVSYFGAQGKTRTTVTFG